MDQLEREKAALAGKALKLNRAVPAAFSRGILSSSSCSFRRAAFFQKRPKLLKPCIFKHFYIKIIMKFRILSFVFFAAFALLTACGGSADNVAKPVPAESAKPHEHSESDGHDHAKDSTHRHDDGHDHKEGDGHKH